MPIQQHQLLRWTERLTGLDPDESHAALAEIESWGISHLTAEMVDSSTIDSVVASVLLCGNVAELVERGVPRSKLLAKLRGDRDCWSAWSEIHMTTILAHGPGSESEVRLEPHRGAGRHADVHFSIPGTGRGTTIEIKALGLSDEELAFLRAVDEVLDRLCPPVGMVTVHTDLETGIALPSRAERRERAKMLRKAQASAPAAARGLAAATLVAHVTEERYLIRLADRVKQALEQLPPEDPCWVALSWTNGAASSLVHQAINMIDLPSHVHGVMLVGSAVCFPDPMIHHYWLPLGAGTVREGPAYVHSIHGNPSAGLILELFENSAGVRAVLMKDAATGETLLRRGGSRRFFPFNLLLQADPEFARAPLRSGHEVVDY